VELRQLVYFDAIVRQGGFTRAAEHLHVAQPAISAQIRRLESELGTVLLQRSTRRVSLTHSGELFLARTRRVLEQLEAARGELDEVSSVLRGRVRIGATPVLGSLDLPAAMATFRRSYPGVSMALRSGLIADLLTALDSGEVDLVLGPSHPGVPPRYTATALVEETLMLVTPPNHRLANGRSGRLAAAKDELFVCLQAGSGLHTILTEAAAADGFVPRIEFETFSPASIRELVAAGLGVALLAASSARAPGPPIEVCELASPPSHPPISVITLRGVTLPPAPNAFHAELRALRDGNGQGVAASTGLHVMNNFSA
jgi:LysR family transcriptional activator of glutamate synthase operon